MQFTAQSFFGLSPDTSISLSIYTTLSSKSIITETNNALYLLYAKNFRTSLITVETELR